MCVATGRHDAQGAFVRPGFECVLANITVNGQQGSYAKISALDIVLFQKREDQVLVEIHKRASIQYNNDKRVQMDEL